MDEPNSPAPLECNVGTLPDPPRVEPAPVADAVSEQPSPQAVVASEPANPVKEATRSRPPRATKTRVARESPPEPVKEPCPELLFAGLNSTLKVLVRQERQQKLASLPIV